MALNEEFIKARFEQVDSQIKEVKAEVSTISGVVIKMDKTLAVVSDRLDRGEYATSATPVQATSVQDPVITAPISAPDMNGQSKDWKSQVGFVAGVGFAVTVFIKFVSFFGDKAGDALKFLGELFSRGNGG